MLDSQQEAAMKQKVEIVFMRSCRAKANDEAKVRDYAKGDKEVFIRRYADELISMRKAAVVGSPDHKAWLEQQKNQPAKVDQVAELKTALAEKEKELAEAQKEIKKLSK
jgi:hypothetical protein